jgi:hypothetical protein
MERTEPSAYLVRYKDTHARRSEIAWARRPLLRNMSPSVITGYSSRIPRVHEPPVMHSDLGCTLSDPEVSTKAEAHPRVYIVQCSFHLQLKLWYNQQL